MHLKYKFKNLKNSKELMEYIEDRMDKLQKYEMKPVSITVTLCVEKHEKRVDIHARGERMSLQAQGNSDNFFESIDLAIDRLAKQMMKKKAKVQNHKCFERTHQGKIERLSPALEVMSYTNDNDEKGAA